MNLRSLTLEIAGYGAASAVALAVDAGVLAALTSLLGWLYLPASGVSFAAGGVVAYLVSVRLAFRFHNLADRSIEAISFVALGLAGLLVNSLVIWFAVSRVGLQLMAAKACAAACTFTVNFALRRQLLFATPAGAAARVTE